MIASGKLPELPERQPESDRARVDRADGKREIEAAGEREIEAAGERERPGNILPGPWDAGCDRSR